MATISWTGSPQQSCLPPTTATPTTGVGNRLTKVLGGNTDTYAYASTSNRIASVTPSSGPVRNFTLDPNGSTTADGVNTYAYDVRGRMVQAVSSLGTTTYQVNALGQRVRKTNTLGDRVFHYDSQGHLIAETTAAGATLKEYLWLGDMPLAVVNGEDRFYVHSDHLNTPRLVANQAGQAVWRWEQQEPFGINLPDENPSSLGAFEFPLRYPGQYADKETNLHYNYFRDYDPTIGRYGESDPVGLGGGINTYLYGNGDSLRFVDPRGEMAGVGVVGGLVLIGGAILMSPPARKTIKDIIKVICTPSAKDPCDQQQEEEEEDCWKNYGSVFGAGHFSHRGCMERARTRGDLCRRGLPQPPQWGDSDVTGHPRPPKPPKV